MTELAAGDRVTVVDRYEGPRAILTVSKAGTNKIILSDGTAWKARSGNAWGSGDRYYTGPTIQPTSDGDAEMIERRRCINRANKAPWQKFSTETLRAVRDAILSDPYNAKAES